LRTAADLARLFSSDSEGSLPDGYFTRLKSDVDRGHAMFKRSLHGVISEITRISRAGPAREDLEVPVLKA
ncbi:MAG TPA: hypothetical protein VLA34_03505, partial [Candidatus Krumholzibacterium sp.]|nr:hypothetical protein [Candidatus Krumholzibacterium sp.]